MGTFGASSNRSGQFGSVLNSSAPVFKDASPMQESPFSPELQCVCRTIKSPQHQEDDLFADIRNLDFGALAVSDYKALNLLHQTHENFGAPYFGPGVRNVGKKREYSSKRRNEPY
jgi:hypothetical protein